MDPVVGGSLPLPDITASANGHQRAHETYHLLEKPGENLEVYNGALYPDPNNHSTYCDKMALKQNIYICQDAALGTSLYSWLIIILRYSNPIILERENLGLTTADNYVRIAESSILSIDMVSPKYATTWPGMVFWIPRARTMLILSLLHNHYLLY